MAQSYKLEKKNFRFTNDITLVVLTLTFISSVLSQPTGPTWVSYFSASSSQPWIIVTNITGIPVCNQDVCCCPEGQVVTFLQQDSPGELFFNATFYSKGNLCQGNSNGPFTDNDNLDFPFSSSVTQEFFGIDSQTITVTNASAALFGQYMLLLNVTDNANGSCSYVATKNVGSAANMLNPNANDPCYNNGPCGSNGACSSSASGAALCNCKSGFYGPNCIITQSEETVAQNWFGTWTSSHNSGCGTDPTCCCLQKTVNIYTDPSGQPNVFINGTGIGGSCNTIVEQDDFPYPDPTVAGNNANAGVSSANLWDTQDLYVLNLALNVSAGQWRIQVADQRDSNCSFVLTRPYVAPAPSTTSTTSKSGISRLTLSPFLLLFVLLLIKI
jgi:hypothetical protein